MSLFEKMNKALEGERETEQRETSGDTLQEEIAQLRKSYSQDNDAVADEVVAFLTKEYSAFLWDPTALRREVMQLLQLGHDRDTAISEIEERYLYAYSRKLTPFERMIRAKAVEIWNLPK